MKKILILMMGLLLLFSICACAKNEKVAKETQKEQTVKTEETKVDNSNANKTELIVFAAASMTETMNDLKPKYETKNPNVIVTYNFDSSGTLLKQILAGSDCDLFISAAQKQMNQLDINKDEKDNKDRNDFLLPNTRKNLLENKVALVVPNGNPKNITSFKDLLTDKLSLLAIGNSDVPVGSYTLDILKSLGTSAEELEKQNKITYGSNVKEVTTQVAEGLVDAGIVYATDAFSAKLQVVDTATKDMCKQVIYPVAVLKNSKNQEEAKKFEEYLFSDEAMNVFKNVGFEKAQ